MLDNEAIELEFISVLIYYTYKRKLEREESMMCRNDKSRVDPKWKTQQLVTRSASGENLLIDCFFEAIFACSKALLACCPALGYNPVNQK